LLEKWPIVLGKGLAEKNDLLATKALACWKKKTYLLVGKMTHGFRKRTYLLGKEDLITWYQRTCLLEKWPICLRKGLIRW
jgi:hypothetical protein